MAIQSIAKIRESLIEQLQSLHADVPHFLELVDSYIDYCKLEREAKKDIKKNGMSYKAISSTGKEFDKDNPYGKMLPQYTKAKLQILKDLGLTTKNVSPEEDEEL